MTDSVNDSALRLIRRMAMSVAAGRAPQPRRRRIRRAAVAARLAVDDRERSAMNARLTATMTSDALAEPAAAGEQALERDRHDDDRDDDEADQARFAALGAGRRSRRRATAAGRCTPADGDAAPPAGGRSRNAWKPRAPRIAATTWRSRTTRSRAAPTGGRPPAAIGDERQRREGEPRDEVEQ